MSHHTATIQSTSATVFDFACTVAERLYWLDDNYVQPFYSWAADSRAFVTWLSAASIGDS